MRNKFLLFLILILFSSGAAIKFNQHTILAESVAISTTGNWSDPLTLSELTDDSITPVLRQDNAGNMIVVYSSKTEGSPNNTPYYHLWDKNTSTWGNPNVLYQSVDDNIHPDVAYDHNSNAIPHAVWSHQTTSILYADEPLWPSQVISISVGLPDDSIIEPAIAIDSNNNAHVVWAQNSKIYYASDTGNSWNTPDEIGSDFSSHAAVISIDDNDTVHVAWVGLITTVNPPQFQIRYLNKPATGNWSTVKTVSGSRNAESPYLLADGDQVHLSFTEFNGTDILQKIYYVELNNNNPELFAVVEKLYTNSSGGISNNGANSSMAACGGTLHLYYYGSTESDVDVIERIQGLSRDESGWGTPAAVTPVDDQKRAINPTIACGGASVYVIYEEIPTQDAPHTINYIYSTTAVYLPVIFK